jgi:hypothetical protein
MRAVVERCQGTEANGRPRMHTLVTMGGQHQVEIVPSVAQVPIEDALLKPSMGFDWPATP